MSELQLPYDDYRRYGRQMVLDGIGLPGVVPQQHEFYAVLTRPPGQVKLQEASVAVVGAGGLGCPALQYLAAAGVGAISSIVELSAAHLEYNTVCVRHTWDYRPRCGRAVESAAPDTPFPRQDRDAQSPLRQRSDKAVRSPSHSLSLQLTPPPESTPARPSSHTPAPSPPPTHTPSSPPTPSSSTAPTTRRRATSSPTPPSRWAGRSSAAPRRSSTGSCACTASARTGRATAASSRRRRAPRWRAAARRWGCWAR